MTYTIYTLQGHGQTHSGLSHTKNEDALYLDNERGIFVVADGVGGAAAGEVASRIVIESFADLKIKEGESIGAALKRSFIIANNEMIRQVALNPALKGMASVATACMVKDNVLYVAHVGDTRLYKITAQQIQKQTFDHSPVGILEDTGKITETQAMAHPQRNAVNQALGLQVHNSETAAWIELASFDLSQAPQARWLLCSDGLSDLVSKQEIFDLVNTPNTPDQICKHLINRANMYGGKDNITVILLSPEKKTLTPPPLAAPLVTQSLAPPQSRNEALSAPSAPLAPPSSLSQPPSLLKLKALYFALGFLLGIAISFAVLYALGWLHFR